MLTTGQQIDLSIEKPAAGGRMIARHDGQVVLVAGAVPGERVTAVVERTERRLAFATVAAVRDPSPDRRAAFADPLCGGCVFSHIAYPRQLQLKAEIVRDAYLRLGRLRVDADIDVAPSPERDYRMRARFHVRGRDVGFYREGTHTLCDAAATGQVTEAALAIVTSAVERFVDSGVGVASVELTENIAGDQRALSVVVDDMTAALAERAAGALGYAANAVRGSVLQDQRGKPIDVGEPNVADPLDILSQGRAGGDELRRHAASFFQANRFLVPVLVAAVLDAVAADGPLVDLYAGVGLFSLAAAAAGHQVIAVEGDAASGADLESNARGVARLRAVRDSVEHFLASRTLPASCTVIVDPPRTGMSPAAMRSLLKAQAKRVVYVSCDPATMARDARLLVDGGYQLDSLRAFDLFPNTPHIESMAILSAER